MDDILSEIREIPRQAEACMEYKVPFPLPLYVPYVGMGSSYFSAIAFKNMGIDIYPEIASEYFQYVRRGRKLPMGVILSQSGESSEPVWCTQLFDRYIAITNDIKSSLAKAPHVTTVVPLHAGEEKFSSSKTYINTLLTLFKGLGLNAAPAVEWLQANFEIYEQRGRVLSEQVYDRIKKVPTHGIYILGSGPNVATAMEAGLILSESTKLTFSGMSLAQYDHGPKETAAGSIVIQILAKGPAYERAKQLSGVASRAGAFVLTVEEPAMEEQYSVLHNIVPFNFMAYYLSRKLGVKEIFAVGGKITKEN